MSGPAVSVVIPTHKRPDLLGRCLDALVNQTLAPSRYEIVVADDAASPATAGQVAFWADRREPAVRYVAVGPAHGPAAARNCGWRAAAAPIIAFTDDDCIPSPRWLEEGIAAMSTGADAASGQVVMPLPPSPTDYERDASRLQQAGFVTANCFCRRSALESVGGFDERFALAWREDSDLYFSLDERGFQIVTAPRAVVVHPIRPAPWGISLQQQRKSMFNALLYRKHPQLYRRYIQPSPPWPYYQTLAAAAATLAAMAAGRGPLALLSAGAWTGLTASFCAARLSHTSRAPHHVAEVAITSVLIPPLSVFWRLAGAVKYRTPFL